MGSKSKQTSSERQTTTPDAFTDQWRQQIFNQGNALMGQQTPNYQVAPMSDVTQQGLQGMAGYAQGGIPQLGQAYGANQQQMSGWNPAMPYAQNAASGGLSNNPGMGMLFGASQRQVAPQVGGMINGATQINPWTGSQTTAGVGTLQDAASGGAMNPFLNGLFNAASAPVMNAVNSNFAQAGRYGGNAAHTGAMTRELGNLANSIYAPAYESERGRQLSAAGQLAGLQQGDYNRNASLYESGAGRMMQGAGLYGDLATNDANRAMSGAAGIGSLWDAGADRSMQGAGMLGGLYNTGVDQSNRAIGNVSSLFQTGAMPYQMQADVGGAYDAQNQAVLDAQYQNQNAPWDRYTEFAQVLQGLPLFGTTTGTGTQRTRGSSFGWNPQSGFSFGG
jgi:hypothetical protein